MFSLPRCHQNKKLLGPLQVQKSLKLKDKNCTCVDTIYTNTKMINVLYNLTTENWLSRFPQHTQIYIKLHHPHETTQHSMWWRLFGENCELIFILVIIFCFSSQCIGLYNSGVLFIQCITTVSVRLSLSYLYLKLECFIYLCMSFYIIIALDFVFQ